MMFSKDALIATAFILLVGAIGYLMASSEKASDRCMEMPQSADVCAYIFR